MSGLRVALVHDYIYTYAGSERVLEQMIRWFKARPDVESVELFCIVCTLPESRRGFLQGVPVTESFVRRLPGSRKRFRAYLPFFPAAVEQFDLAGFDIVVSSSFAFAKGVIVGPDQLHLCMCYSPMRYAWDLQHTYLEQSGRSRGLRSVLIRGILHYLRMWDVRTAPGVDSFMAISEYIGRRIRRIYNRDSVVVYPPVDLDRFPIVESGRGDFYVTASRLVPYKRMDLVVKAFADLPDRRLVVIGDGPERQRIERGAPPNVTFLGHAPDDVLREKISTARAFLFASEEDFGIAPIEAMAAGTPVIAYAKGGAVETVGDVDDGGVGVLFHEQTASAISAAVRRFESADVPGPTLQRQRASGFSIEAFQAAFDRVMDTAIRQGRRGLDRLGVAGGDGGARLTSVREDSEARPPSHGVA